MQKIFPCIWLDSQAEEAATFYTSIFANSKMGVIDRYTKAMTVPSGKPEGSVLTVSFELEGQDFMTLNGGADFKPTPAISFYVSCSTVEEIDALWAKLSEGGIALMPLMKYPFSEKFGWVQDKFGVSWQLILATRTQKIVPLLMFAGKVAGRAHDAMALYTSLFANSSIVTEQKYEAGDGDSLEFIKHAEFTLEDQDFMAMDSGLDHAFTFTEGLSFVVDCESQEEIDTLWSTLTKGGQEQPCGWLKDKYGVSWQIAPRILTELLRSSDKDKAERVAAAMLRMQKIDMQQLLDA